MYMNQQSLSSNFSHHILAFLIAVFIKKKIKHAGISTRMNSYRKCNKICGLNECGLGWTWMYWRFHMCYIIHVACVILWKSSSCKAYIYFLRLLYIFQGPKSLYNQYVVLTEYYEFCVSLTPCCTLVQRGAAETQNLTSLSWKKIKWEVHSASQ